MLLCRVVRQFGWLLIWYCRSHAELYVHGPCTLKASKSLNQVLLAALPRATFSTVLYRIHPAVLWHWASTISCAHILWSPWHESTHEVALTQSHRTQKHASLDRTCPMMVVLSAPSGFWHLSKHLNALEAPVRGVWQTT